MSTITVDQERASEGDSEARSGIPAPCGEGCAHIKGKWKRGRCAVHYPRWLRAVPKDERPAGKPHRGRIKPRYATVYDALAAHTVQMPGENGCLMWRGNLAKRRWTYPVITHRGSRYKAHHLAYVLHYQRDIPARMSVLHDCDQPTCVRGDHLSVGTQRENVADMYCRQRWSRKVIKLDWAKVKQIRRQVDVPISVREARALAIDYGVCEKTIRDVVEGRTWIPRCDGVSQ